MVSALLTRHHETSINSRPVKRNPVKELDLNLTFKSKFSLDGCW